MNNYAIILASGTGSRFGSNVPKQFSKICNKTIIEYTIEAFEESDLIDKIILVVVDKYLDFVCNLVQKNNYKKIYKVIKGGLTRKESSFNGVFAIDEINANVLIHDCARPFVSNRIIKDCICALKDYDAVNVAIPCTDTILEIKDNIIQSIPQRSNLRAVQTPQCFKLSTIKKAHQLSKNDSEFSDDCGLVLKHNLCPIFVVEGDVNNFKITYPNDFFLAQKIINDLKIK
ncbi:MAG: 2-C-methyl-D-erythritol 4-phosphate cytidylyltransferase [Candidatus Gastranaerophilales bacterium]|nr:2-C-methyl-D-erythritol 4-phosphate cytidylyltransferase [Candidatus Gastranaerophilales bacterium]